MKDLLNIFGVEVSKCELTTDVSYPRGRVCRGNLKQVLTEIVVNECKSRFIIRHYRAKSTLPRPMTASTTA